MKELLLLTLVIFSAAACLCSDPPVKSDTVSESSKSESGFRGNAVYRVRASTKEAYDALALLYSSQSLDFWTRPKLDDFTDIMVTPQLESFGTDYFRRHNITHQVVIEDVEKLVDEEQGANIKKKGPGIDWNAYYRHEEINSWMEDLGVTYPNLVTVKIIGRSTEGRDIKLIHISKGGEGKRPAIFMDATFHAREWVTAATATYVINQLTTNSSEYPFLDHVDFHILPVVNPDGYEWSHTNNRFWRKTRSHHGHRTCVGVDPNRNFGFQWGGEGTSDHICSDIYKGPHAFSEPETQAVRDYLLNPNINFKAYITIHSYSQLWLTPWGYTNEYPSDYDELESLALEAIAAIKKPYGTKFRVGSSTNVLYSAAGGSDDWAKGVAKVKYSYTTELRDTGRYGFALPPNLITPTAYESWLGYQIVANHIAKNS